MKIDKEDLLRINLGFGGGLRNDASIDFALEKQNEKKLGEYKKLAYLWRAILVDHPFTDGNKRTAVFLAYEFASELDKSADRDLLVHHAQSIAEKNIGEINIIERRLRNAIIVKDISLSLSSQRQAREILMSLTITEKQIKKIMKEHKDAFDMLEEYDRTREFPFRRKRIDVTLSIRAINNLKKLREKTGKPISHLIEEKFV